MAKQRYTADEVATALRETKGMVSLAARRLGCARHTVGAYIGRYPSVAEVLVDEREATTDVAELALYKAIQGGEAWAVCFYLKTQGKARGYVERFEHTGGDGAPLRVTFVIDRTDAEGPPTALPRTALTLLPIEAEGVADGDG